MASDDPVLDFIRSSPSADHAAEDHRTLFIFIFSLVIIVCLFLLSLCSAHKLGEDAPHQNQPLPDTELGRTWGTPVALPREPPHQHRSRHSQIWGPVVPYSAGKIQGGEVESCSICLEEFKGGELCRILFRCDHNYHQTCIDDWLSKNPHCPLCRGSVRRGRN